MGTSATKPSASTLEEEIISEFRHIGERREREKKEEQERREREKEEQKRTVLGAAAAITLGTYLISQTGTEIKKYVLMVAFSEETVKSERRRLARKLGFKRAELTSKILSVHKRSTRKNAITLFSVGAGFVAFGIWFGSDELIRPYKY